VLYLDGWRWTTTRLRHQPSGKASNITHFGDLL
jgi:hypothetical protein